MVVWEEWKGEGREGNSVLLLNLIFTSEYGNMEIHRMTQNVAEKFSCCSELAKIGKLV